MDKPVPKAPPLEPMPSAPAAPIEAWLRRLTVGALLGLILAGCSVGVFAALAAGAGCAYVLLFPISSTLSLAAAWLITAPEPGAQRRMAALRWCVRLGAAAGLVTALSMLVAAGFPQMSTHWAYGLAAAHEVLQFVAGAGLIAMMWYAARLSMRLKDVMLARCFGALKWLFVAGLALDVVFVPAKWHEELDARVQLLRQPALHARGVTAWLPSTGYILVVAAATLFWIWLTWRLWRRLRRAADNISRLPPPRPNAGPGNDPAGPAAEPAEMHAR